MYSQSRTPFRPSQPDTAPASYAVHTSPIRNMSFEVESEDVIRLILQFLKVSPFLASNAAGYEAVVLLLLLRPMAAAFCPYL